MRLRGRKRRRKFSGWKLFEGNKLSQELQGRKQASTAGGRLAAEIGSNECAVSRVFDAEPSASLDSLAIKAKLTDAERRLLAMLVQPSSNCWSISVIAGHERSVFVVREADEGAIRGQIRSCRLR